MLFRLGAAVVGSGAGLMAGPVINAMQSGEKIQKKEREAAAEMKRESRGKEDSMTSGQKQSMQEAKDAEMQTKKDKAYNAAKTYPDDFAKGGKVSSASARADGIAQRGKTRGTIVMCSGGMYKK